MANSALALAALIGTSDATVIRTVKELGYAGMSDLRKCLAAELRSARTPTTRFERTHRSVKTHGALEASLDVQEQSLRKLREDIPRALFDAAVKTISAASSVHVFGIGPSKPIADYVAIQGQRFGIAARALTDAGSGLADALLRIEAGDVMIVLAFGSAYGEALAVLKYAKSLNVKIILISDGTEKRFVAGSDYVLKAQRGKAGEFSMHGATLSLIEALLLGVGSLRPARTVASLKKLEALRRLVANSSSPRNETPEKS